MSAKRSQEMREYIKKRKHFLEVHKFCEACPIFGFSGRHPSEDIHHRFGRANNLLNREPGWIAVCRTAHDGIHRNPKLAQRIGLLADVSEFNIGPKE